MSSRTMRPSFLMRSALVVAFAVMAASLLSAQDKPAATRKPVKEPPNSTEKDGGKTEAKEDVRVRVNAPEGKVTPETAILRFETFNAVKTKVAEDGALVIQDIKEESRAARQGLKKGDRIVEIDGHKLESPNQAASVLTRTVDQPYHIVKVARDGENIEVILGTHTDLMGMLVVPDTSSRPLVRRVQEESPANEAGVRAEDIIVGASGRKTDTYKEFIDFVIPLVRKMSPGQELNLRVNRATEDAEVTLIRPEQLKLPLLEAPADILPEPETVTRPAPRQVEQPRQETASNDYLTGFMGLPTSVPFFGGIMPNGLTTAPATNAVVAVLQPDAFTSLMNSNIGGTVPINPTINTPIDTTRRVLPNAGSVPRGTAAPRQPRQRRVLPQNQTQPQQPQPRQATPPAGGNVPGQPGAKALPQQQLKQVLSNPNPANAGNANPGTANTNPGNANANPVNPNAGTNPNPRHGVVPNGSSNRDARAIAPGTNVDPRVVDPTATGTGINPGLAGGMNPQMAGGFGARGFVAVATDSVTGTFVHARVTGLMPAATYTLAVHQLGDIGAVNQNSAGPVVAILGVIQADALGQAEVQLVLNSSIQPSILLGRAVSLVGGTIADTATTGVDVNGNPLTNNTVTPTVTNGFNYQACGVFGYASPARFNNSGVLILP